MVADLPAQSRFACQANVPQKLCHSTLHGVCLNLRLTRGQLLLLIRQQSQCVHLLVNPSASARESGHTPGAVQCSPRFIQAWATLAKLQACLMVVRHLQASAALCGQPAGHLLSATDQIGGRIYRAAPKG